MPFAADSLAILATVAIVPRERFSHAPATLDSIAAHTPAAVPVIVVDGNPPSAIRAAMEARTQARGQHLIRCDHYLAPNQARNLVLPLVRTPYVVFCDNDLLVSPGWLEALVACAEETGADAVGPIYLYDEPEKGQVHMAGGRLTWSEANGMALLDEHQLYTGTYLGDIRPQLRRAVAEYVEFHCMLVRMSAFARTGPLDEELLSLAEHIDFSLMLRRTGGQIYLEPDASVGYVAHKGHTLADLDYFRLRWSDDWNTRTLARFEQKWKLSPECRFLETQRLFVAGHRMSIGLPRQCSADRVLSWASPHHGYAQTNIQLYNQLDALGWAAHDVQRADEAYDFAVALFGPLLRSNGKPFTAHVVGTASILAAHGASTGAVLAALVHAAYDQGRFGESESGATPDNRARVRAVLGKHVEAIVFAYSNFDWTPSNATRIADHVEHLSLGHANLVFMRLANVLEEYLDRGMIYGGKPPTEAKAWLPAFTAVAARLEVPALAGELAAAIDLMDSLPLPSPIRRAESASFAPVMRAAE